MGEVQVVDPLRSRSIVGCGGGVLLRKPSASSMTPAPVPNPMEPLPRAAQSPLTHSTQLLQALKEEMFVLETDHLQHHISDEDYVAQKAALELVLRRALQRSNANERELISR